MIVQFHAAPRAASPQKPRGGPPGGAEILPFAPARLSRMEAEFHRLADELLADAPPGSAERAEILAMRDNVLIATAKPRRDAEARATEERIVQWISDLPDEDVAAAFELLGLRDNDLSPLAAGRPRVPPPTSGRPEAPPAPPWSPKPSPAGLAALRRDLARGNRSAELAAVFAMIFTLAEGRTRA